MDKLLGKQAKDKVTGFEGIITAKCEYMYGCSQYGLTPPAKDGKINDTAWFDEGRITIIGEGIEPEAVQAEQNGCEFREHPSI